jgi:hypothetical protein
MSRRRSPASQRRAPPSGRGTAEDNPARWACAYWLWRGLLQGALGGAAETDQLVVVDRLAADDRGLQLLGAQREPRGLADQFTLDLGDVAAGLGLIGGADVSESARGRAATIDVWKQPRPIADLVASRRTTGVGVGANTLDTMMMTRSR